MLGLWFPSSFPQISCSPATSCLGPAEPDPPSRIALALEQARNKPPHPHHQLRLGFTGSGQAGVGFSPYFCGENFLPEAQVPLLLSGAFPRAKTNQQHTQLPAPRGGGPTQAHLGVGRCVKSGGCVGTRRGARQVSEPQPRGWSSGQVPGSLERVPTSFTIYRGPASCPVTHNPSEPLGNWRGRY